MSQGWRLGARNVPRTLTDRGRGRKSSSASWRICRWNGFASRQPRFRRSGVPSLRLLAFGSGSRVKKHHLWVGLYCSLAALGAAAPAFASIEECGDINIDPDATCTVEVEGGCEAQCTPVHVEAACAAELEVDCRGQCDVDANL